MSHVTSATTHALQRFGVPHYDLAARDKVPLLRRLLATPDDGLALDIGIGTGYTTRAILGERPTACVDVHLPNLRYYRAKIAAHSASAPPLCVRATACALPFRDATFRIILCSEVLEHVLEEDLVVSQIARVLAPDGIAVITVPYSGFGFTSFLELAGIRSVHDYPGPEQHVRPGYTEASLDMLLARHGLAVERHLYCGRFFTRVGVDLVSLAHLAYQRLVFRRSSWTWSEAAAAEGGWAFRLYTWLFPVLRLFSRLDRLLGWARGFGLVAVVRKAGCSAAGAGADRQAW